MRHLLVVLVLVLSASCASPRAGEARDQTGFLFRSVETRGQRMEYVVYVPRGYAATSGAYPCILFLHGSGESGWDGQKQAIQGIGSAILWNAAKWPFIVVMPQKPSQEKQWEEYDGAVMAALAEVEREYRVDRSRVYLTGLSQGGHGTWMIGSAHPRAFAAIAPICGYVTVPFDSEPDPAAAAALAERVKGLPVWAFHGLADDVVKPDQTTALVDAIKATGGDARVTLYPSVNHNAWDKAYREEDLPAWFLEHRK